MLALLDSLPSDSLRVYVVWEAVLASDDSAAAARRAGESDDPRLVHFWDPEKLTGSAWRHVLSLPRFAWDVYFVFGADAGWGDMPPRPDFWQHQGVGADIAPVLDRAELISGVKRLVHERSAHE